MHFNVQNTKIERVENRKRITCIPGDANKKIFFFSNSVLVAVNFFQNFSIRIHSHLVNVLFAINFKILCPPPRYCFFYARSIIIIIYFCCSDAAAAANILKSTIFARLSLCYTKYVFFLMKRPHNVFVVIVFYNIYNRVIEEYQRTKIKMYYLSKCNYFIFFFQTNRLYKVQDR